MRNIEVDVVLPAHLDHGFLLESIQSVKKSIGVHTRIILVDNAAKPLESAREVLRPHDIYLRSIEMGFASALNLPFQTGLEFSEYVAYMNSDDLTAPNRLIEQISSMCLQNSELSICDYTKFSNGRVEPKLFGELSIDSYHPLFLLFGSYGSNPTWVMTKKWYVERAIRSTNVHPDLADLEVALKYFPDTRISTVPKPLYLYRVHRRQMSRNMAKLADFIQLSELIYSFTSRYSIPKQEINTLFSLRPQHPIERLKYSVRKDEIFQLCHLVLSRIESDIFLSHEQRMQLMQIINLRANMHNPAFLARLAIRNVCK